MTAVYAEPDTLSDIVPGWAYRAGGGGWLDSALDYPVPNRGGKVLAFPDRRRVVGLHGFAQTGKDTVAAYLREEQGWEQVILAQPILDALLLLNPIVKADRYGNTWTFREVYDDEGYEGAKKVGDFRRLMQAFGTEVGREHLGTLLGLNQSMWLEIATKKVADPGRYVVSDVRFTDEVEWTRRVGGTLIKITRPGYGSINGHVSDAGLPDHLFDHVIENDGTIEDLHTKVRVLLGDA